MTKKQLCEKGQKCSCWFDGWFGKDWSSCCEEHDDDYTYEVPEKLDRKEADLLFRECLKMKGACFVMRWCMYYVVRIFGKGYNGTFRKTN